MKTILSIPLCVMLLCLGLRAQVVYVVDSASPGSARDVNLPSPVDPAGGGSHLGTALLPASAALAAGPLAGGATIDQTNSTVYVCDGTLITQDYNPRYLPFVVVPPVILPPSPAPTLLTGGPITGLAIDPTAGILWMTDGFSLGGFTTAPPYLPVVAPVPLAFLTPVFPGLTGLDWEPSTGTFWGCDAQGNIYHFTAAGAPLGPQPVSTIPTAGPLGGLAVDRSNGPGAIGIPFCSTQVPGFHINVTDGVAIYDGLVPGLLIPMATPSLAPARGLAFAADFQIAKGSVGCPPTGGIPAVGTIKATHNGPGGANALRYLGGAPLTTTLLLYDNCPIPGGLFIPASGETLWLNPLSPTFGFATFVTNAAGSITVPVNFSPSLPGLRFTLQWAIFDPASPLGYCLSDAVQIISGLP